jgi:drug/metabolite transporter (DMT)-like permease
VSVPGVVLQRAKTPKLWLVYALATTALWGVWGAFTDVPTRHGFPETLIYCVWSLTMVLPALYALAQADWRLDRDLASVTCGMIIGLLGAGGQIVLFYAVTMGPPYLIFPIISLSPIVTIALSFLLLHERTNALGAAGIALALLALPLFDISPAALNGSSSATSVSGPGWFLLSLIVMGCWGLQAYFMKVANRSMTAESIFFYMTVAGLLIAPVAWVMTDFTQPINWGMEGPWLAAATQILNSIGALMLVYAFRYGQAIVISPLVNAGAPLMTAIISLIVVGALPGPTKLVALALACMAAFLLALTPEEEGMAVRSPDERRKNPALGHHHPPQHDQHNNVQDAG